MKRKKHWKSKINLLFALGMLCVATGCENTPDSQISDPTQSSDPNAPLPFLPKGEEFGKTPYTTPKFSLTNQNEVEFSHKDVEGKILIIDFFFTHCPTICPVMSSQMARLQRAVADAGMASEVEFISHTIDPERDDPAQLRKWAESISADTTNWNFLTGERDFIYYLAKDGYFITALADDTAAGGFYHSDQFVLVDQNRHIRGFYEGTSTKAVDKLFNDLKKLDVK